MNLKNKKGFALEGVFETLVVSLVFVLILGVLLYAFGVIDTSITGENLVVGGTNISNDSANTIGKINTAFLDNADLIGLLFLFGLILALMINGFLTREENPPLFFIIDFLLIIFAYILAVYISNSYETILNVLPFNDVLIANMGNTNRFMLLLPKITVIAGVITMIVTYTGIPKTKEEEIAGF